VVLFGDLKTLSFWALLIFVIASPSGCSNNSNTNGTPQNLPPVFTSTNTITVNEGVVATGYSATATDPDGDPVSYSISGGADANEFVILSTTGALSFKTATDFENPTDSDHDNNYVILITASDGAASAQLSVTITVLNVQFGLLENGVIALNGVAAGDVGFAIASSGDVDGDNLDDLIIGAFEADANGVNAAGQSYLIYGSSLLKDDDGIIELSEVGGASDLGVRFDGENANDTSGVDVSSVGDIDLDGLADVLIGAPSASPGGITRAGQSYLVFGKSIIADADHIIPLAEIGVVPGLGVRIDGANAGDLAGTRVARAGDVDGDGKEDLLIEATRVALPFNNSISNQTFLLFGQAILNDSDGVISLSDVGASLGLGVRFDRENISDIGGTSVAAGDVDADGFDDILIGAESANEAYILFGIEVIKDPDNIMNLGDVGVIQGLGIEISGKLGGKLGDTNGMSGAGDIDRDGFSDVILGDANLNGPQGEAYIFNGYALSSDPDEKVSATDLPGNSLKGVTLLGAPFPAEFGVGVAIDGDVDGDGMSDVLVGDNQTGAGITYLYLGAQFLTDADGTIPITDIRSVPGLGVQILGVAPGDKSGFTLAFIGDLDGDGGSEVAINASQADPGGRINAGQSYIISSRLIMDSIAANAPIDLNNYPH